MFNYKIVKSFDKNLESNWNSLISNSNHTFFQKYELNKLWYNLIGSKIKSSKLLIFEFYYYNKITAIAPLILIKKNYFFNEIVFLGQGLFDYQLIINSDSSNTKLQKFIFKTIKSHDSIDIISLSNIPNFFENNNLEYSRYLDFVSEEVVSMATLPNSFDSYFNSLKTSVRGDSRRQSKKLNNLGKLSYEVIKEQQEMFLDNLIHYKRMRYKKTLVRDLFNNSDYITFFKELINSKLRNNIHCSVLNIDDVSISYHLGFYYNSKYYYFMPSFVEKEWGKYSPSRVHMLKIIEESISNKLSIFDFTIGNENYKKYFTDKRNKVRNYSAYISINGYFFKIINPIYIFLKNIIMKFKIIRKFLFKTNSF